MRQEKTENFRFKEKEPEKLKIVFKKEIASLWTNNIQKANYFSYTMHKV